MDYIRVPSDETNGSENDDLEEKELLHSIKYRTAVARNLWWTRAAIATVILNVCIATIFVISTVRLGHGLYCVPGPQPPWSPIHDDGVIRYINTEYKPQKIFQSETSDEVEEAWEGWLSQHDHLLILPKNQTEGRLPVTMDAFLDPGYSVYGFAVYHQMHCLNHIRKTFHADKFFPNASHEMVLFHKNHCFDMLRQAIMCHGDLAVLHWWNDTYSYVDDAGVFHLTDHYLNLTPSQRAEGTFAKWDAPVQCRDLAAINEWNTAHSMDDAKYAATVGQLRRRGTS